MSTTIGSDRDNTCKFSGNLTNDARVTYTYTARGRGSSATIGTAKTSYRYNGLGQRVRQVTGTTVNPTGLLVYDEAGHIIGEYNSSTGQASKEFVYLGDTPVGVLEQVVTGVVPNQVHATNVYYVYTDHLDTPRVITRSPDGKMVWRWDSADPFGLLPPNDNPAGLGVFTFNLRMPGQYFDKSTNLFYNYFRDYDPQLGRYVQSDPIGLIGGVGTYSYVAGNPAGLSDVFGLSPRRLDPASQECLDLNSKIKRKSDLIAKLGRELYERKQRLSTYPSIPGRPDKFSRIGHAERLQREINFRDRDIQRYNDKCGPPAPPPPVEAAICSENCKRISKKNDRCRDWCDYFRCRFGLRHYLGKIAGC